MFAEYRKITKMQFRALMLFKSTGRKQYIKLYNKLEPTRKELYNQIMKL